MCGHCVGEGVCNGLKYPSLPVVLFCPRSFVVADEDEEILNLKQIRHRLSNTKPDNVRYDSRVPKKVG